MIIMRNVRSLYNGFLFIGDNVIFYHIQQIMLKARPIIHRVCNQTCYYILKYAHIHFFLRSLILLTLFNCIDFVFKLKKIPYGFSSVTYAALQDSLV